MVALPLRSCDDRVALWWPSLGFLVVFPYMQAFCFLGGFVFL